MISLPTSYTSGYAAKYPVTYFIDVTVLSGSTVRHLYITNQPSMLFTYGGNVLSQVGGVSPVQSSYLGAYINNSGRETSVEGIGEIDFTIDNTGGGGVASQNTLSLIFLNQGSFVKSHQYDFENQPVKVFKGFMSQSSSVSVDGVTPDMVPIFEGVITQAYTYDPVQFELSCVDRRQIDTAYMQDFFLNGDPVTGIPQLDQNAIGKYIPTVFGDFLTANQSPAPHSLFTLSQAGSLSSVLYPYAMGTLSAVPTQIVDIYQGQAVVSDIPFSMSGNVYVTDGANQYIAVIPVKSPLSQNSNWQFALNSGSSSTEPISSAGTPYNMSGTSSAGIGFQIAPGKLVSLVVTPDYGEAWIVPSRLSNTTADPHGTIITQPFAISGVGPGYVQTHPILNFGDAIDGDLNTHLDIPDTACGFAGYIGFLAVAIPSLSEPGTLVNFSQYGYAYDIDDPWLPLSQSTPLGDGVTDFVVGMAYSLDATLDPNTMWNAWVGGPTGHSNDGGVHWYPSTTALSMSGSMSGTLYVQEWSIGGWYMDGANGTIGNNDYKVMTWDQMKKLGIYITGLNTWPTPGNHLRIHHLWFRCRTKFENSGVLKSYQFVPTITAEQTLVPTHWHTVAGMTLPDMFKPVVTGYRPGTSWEVRGAGVSNLFVAPTGPTYTANMLSASGSALSMSAGTVIQNPAGVIEYILTEKLNVPYSSIDTAAFAKVGNGYNGQRKGWNLASSMLEYKSAQDYIGQICTEFALSLFITQAGKYRVVAHDTVASPVYNIVASDIYFDGYPQISIETTTNDIILNDFVLQYAMDYTLSKPAQSVYVSQVNSDGIITSNMLSSTGALRNTTYTGWLQDSLTRYGVLSRMNQSSALIQDQTTANLAIRKMMDWLAFKRLLVHVECVRNMNIEALEPGDIIKITSDYLTTIFSNTAQFMIVGLRVPGNGSTTNPYIDIDCIELPSANTGTPILSARFISSDDLVAGT